MNDVKSEPAVPFLDTIRSERKSFLTFISKPEKKIIVDGVLDNGNILFVSSHCGLFLLKPRHFLLSSD